MIFLQPWKCTRQTPNLKFFGANPSSLARAIQVGRRRHYQNLSPAEDEVPDFGDYSIILPPEPFVFGTSHIKSRSVPNHIRKPSYALNPNDSSSTSQKFRSKSRPNRIALGTDAEFHIREAGKLAKRVREHARTLVKVGVTTGAIDAAIHEYIIAHGAYPSPLLYGGFPKSCCTSVNNIITHGIPDDRPLEDGDIINIDVTIYLNGYHGDTSETFLVGNVDAKGRSLVSMSLQALRAGISACGPGRPLKSIGKGIHEVVYQPRKLGLEEESTFSVCPQFTGHGIGTQFHTEPWIHHDINEGPGTMFPGDCFTIEPPIIQGSEPRAWIFPDGWTASTENCARSALAEHMVLITETGVDILTD